MDPERLDDLIARHFDGDLNEAEEHELKQALSVSPEARARMASFMRMEGATTRIANASLIRPRPDYSEQATLRKRSSRRGARPVRRWPAYAGAAAACIALAVFAYFYSGSSAPETVLARLSSDYSGVRITRGDKTRSAEKSQEVRSGDLLDCTQSAALKFVGQETSLEADAGCNFSVTQTEGGLRINLKHGAISASVTPQPPGRPMIFQTPSADAEVIGTRLTLACDGETRLDVQHGRVRLTRHFDGKSVDVAAGSFAVAGNGGGELAAQAIAAPVSPVVSSETVRALAFLDDNVLFCAGHARYAKPAVIAVECATGKRVGNYPSDIGTVTELAASRDGKFLACGSDNGAVTLYDTATRKLLKNVENGAAGTVVRCLQFSADGKWLAWCSGKQFHVWNAESAQALKFPPQDGEVLAVAFHPDSSRLASGEASGKVKLWSLAAASETGTFLSGDTGVAVLAFTRPTGLSLVVGLRDTTVTMWRVAEKSAWHSQRESHALHSFLLSADSKLMVIGCDDEILRYWRQSATDIQEFSTVAHRAAISAMAISPGDTLATAAAHGEVKIWGEPFPQCSATLHPFAEP